MDTVGLNDTLRAAVRRTVADAYDASRKQWEKIVQEKAGPCRVCTIPRENGHGFPVIEFHHIVSRGDRGDDVPDNIAPLCHPHHMEVTLRNPAVSALFLAALTDAEYAYMIMRGGEDYPERAYGIEYRR
jgi:hypothetical protein